MRFEVLLPVFMFAKVLIAQECPKGHFPLKDDNSIQCIPMGDSFTVEKDENGKENLVQHGLERLGGRTTDCFHWLQKSYILEMKTEPISLEKDEFELLREGTSICICRKHQLLDRNVLGSELETSFPINGKYSSIQHDISECIFESALIYLEKKSRKNITKIYIRIKKKSAT